MNTKIFESILNKEHIMESTDLAEIERHMHRMFEVLDEALKMSKVKQSLRNSVATKMLQCFKYGIDLGITQPSEKEIQEWVFKFTGYGV